MDIDKVILSPIEMKNIEDDYQGAWQEYERETVLTKAAQLKLLKVLEDEGILRHDHYSRQVYACPICNLKRELGGE
jgi:predicted alpha/beta hydrolase